MAKFTTLAAAPTRATTLLTPSSTSSSLIQCRFASFVARPRRPYKFTQLVTLSDGSTYTARTTSPHPVYRTAKDSRNSVTWQPNERSLRGVELDEAGRLAAFRQRFGRGFDASQASEEGGEAQQQQKQQESAPADDYADLLSAYAPQDTGAMKESGPKKNAVKRK